MKIKKIHINNILSYGDETIELNNDLNVIVGPNGSGKSNLLNIIIFVLKKFCFRNYEISSNYSANTTEIKKYSIVQKQPLYNLPENFFLQKHNNKKEDDSFIDFTISFESQDINNLNEIKNYQDKLNDFLDHCVNNISILESKYSINISDVKKIFELKEEDLQEGKDITLKIHNIDYEWKVENADENFYIYMKYFSLLQDILNIIGIKSNLKNPFIFFEAYRNNSNDTTKASISEYNNQQYTNMLSLPNLFALVSSIGTNSTYITLATKKYGKMMRNAIEKKNGKEEFFNSSDYKRLKSFFEKFNYNINLECVSPENNIYQFFLEKDGLKIEMDTISSGEREIINFIFGLFLEQLNDGIIIIDEPELHLHPTWQKKLIQILKEETKDKNVQIILVTHSSSFISYDILNNIYRIYKEKGYSKCLRINDLLDTEDKNNIRKSLNIINATNNEKIFFSNYVILVEGITDEILFKKIYESEIGEIPDGLEFVNISGKRNLNNFKTILDKLKIQSFYIGDYDNLYDIAELKTLFAVDVKAQEKDLKKEKNQSYSSLDLIKSIENFINNQNEENLNTLKFNYKLYNEHFLKNKKNLSQEEKKKIEQFINNKYKENFYILKRGEIEKYLGTGGRSKSDGFNKVISLITNKKEYNEFKKTESFSELEAIIKDISKKIE